MACGGVQPLREVFKKQTPYEKYEQSLKTAKLENTALGREWMAAGQRALRDSLTITLPFKETGYFAADKPAAISYRLSAKRGQRLVIGTEIKSTQPVQVFIDVFELNNASGRNPRHVATADTNTASLSYEVEEDQIHLIRLQPELLTSGNYTISITREPTLAFPIPGKNSKQIGSVWGVPRDGGARRHEGVDIFARKGTPVIASTNGYIRAANENNLGGKVVWLSDENRNQVLYYAHLDSQLVRGGERVEIGDTIGLVGNTGNARTTAPHLHFGIYRSGRGAFDPFPALQLASEDPQPVIADMKRLATWARVGAKKASVRIAPDAKATLLLELDRNTPVYITGGAANWYKVKLPNEITGYVSSTLIENLEKPLRTQRLQAPGLLLEQPDSLAPFVTALEAGDALPVLAENDEFLFVQTLNGEQGWIPKSAEIE
ncbi:peptidoglycan DD-metalloendopeptidase family protein [Rhodocytophaga rosea]|uniref:Peptidoglycan DD-metalloendopeptidase family protein n=2 Tax=Rhodocytophaga rosea TaxID=2704465 RepID=A0A6C0GVG8_9BACT|nr:peptidoglycan DD-metalloendopeptidase family protein [Rhodocytophaga rosea]